MKPLISLISVAGIAGSLAVTAGAQPARAPEKDLKTEQTAAATEAKAITERVFTSRAPAATYKSLDEADRKKFMAAITPGDVEVTTSETPLKPEQTAEGFSGCWSLHQKFARKALAGNTLYTYWQSTHVCTSKGKVTKVWVSDAGGETSTPGWRIDKHPNTSTKNVRWEGRGAARYHFVLGAGPWDIQHPVDCIQERLNADGRHYQTTKSCDLAG